MRHYVLSCGSFYHYSCESLCSLNRWLTHELEMSWMSRASIETKLARPLVLQRKPSIYCWHRDVSLVMLAFAMMAAIRPDTPKECAGP